MRRYDPDGACLRSGVVEDGAEQQGFAARWCSRDPGEGGADDRAEEGEGRGDGYLHKPGDVRDVHRFPSSEAWPDRLARVTRSPNF